MSTGTVKLYSSWECPFAQRVWIALLEKGVEFEYCEVDPYNKTPEFLAVCPRGLVPSLIHNGRIIYESNVCVEYVDEAFPGNKKLLPSDPYDRAVSRIWVDYIGKKIVPLFCMILQRQDKSEQESAMAEYSENLETIAKAMSKDGPYFLGKDFGFVDIVLVPFTLLSQILVHYRGFELPTTGAFARLHTFMEAAHARESVKATLADTDRLIANYQRYADNTATSEVAIAIRKGTALP